MNSAHWTFKKNSNKKSNKKDRILVKFHNIISFLNFFGKVMKKLVAEKLSQFCKAKKALN